MDGKRDKIMILLFTLVFATSGGLISKELYLEYNWESIDDCMGYAQFIPTIKTDGQYTVYYCKTVKNGD
jgi:hypothetical protein